MNDEKTIAKESRPGGSTPPDCSQVCSECGWTNVHLWNLGEQGKPRWVCQGCCKRAIEAVDKCREAIKPVNVEDDRT